MGSIYAIQPKNWRMLFENNGRDVLLSASFTTTLGRMQPKKRARIGRASLLCWEAVPHPHDFPGVALFVTELDN
ncbi:unnamed protein product [Heligmosomoides polygyrus]|uniref:DUF4442 domain-containing protein n=1 Tax=Heligmosomoides polygyrus TaxID=6339 RepID=A0A183GS17_HELPZ|nr:unnamed protein product [Heligmosomoides polygyrus]